MPSFPLISADSHIVEPPDMYTSRFSPKLRNRAPHMERRKTPSGREYDAWMLDGTQVGTLGAVMQAGQMQVGPLVENLIDQREPDGAAEVSHQIEQARGILDSFRRKRPQRDGIVRHHDHHQADAAQDLRDQQLIEVIVAGNPDHVRATRPENHKARGQDDP